MNSKQLREERAKFAAQIRAHADKANNEKRDFNAEERANWDKLNGDYDAMTARIETTERAEKIEAEQRAPQDDPANMPGHSGRGHGPDSRQIAAEDGDRPERREEMVRRSEDESLVLQGWMANQDARINIDDETRQKQEASARRLGVDIRRGEISLRFGDVLRERRALGDSPLTVTTTAGGYLIPVGFSNELERSMLAFSPLDQIARPLITPSGQDIHWPTIDDTSQAGEMLSINTAAADGPAVFSEVVLKAFKGSSKGVVVPYELIQDSAFDMASLLGSLLGERIGRLRAAQTTTGGGTTAPTGVVTAAGAGVTAASATAFTADELLDLLHSVDPAYRDSSLNFGFMAKDSTIKMARKLKDGSGQYIWQNGTQAGQPQTLFGWPVFVNQGMATVAGSAKTWLAGAFRKFIIRTVGEIRIRRLVERYAEKDQECFIAFVRFDSNLLDAGTDPVKYLVQA